MININEIDSLIASYTDNLTDVEKEELKRLMIKNLIQDRIAHNKLIKTGIFLNGIYFRLSMSYQFTADDIVIYSGNECIGIVKYENVKEWS